MNVFSMVGSIALEGGEQANKQLEQLNSGGKKSAISLKQVGKAVAGATVALGAMGASVGVLVKKVTGLTDDIDKQSQRLGLSRKAYQEWEFVLSQNGASINTLQMGMKTLAQRMDQAIEGAGAGAELFKRLGVEITESMTQEEAFDITVKGLQGVENEVERASLATQLLGRTGQEIIPMLNQTEGSIDALKQTAHEYGLILNDDVIDAGVRMTDTMDRISRAFRSAMANAIGPFIPQIESLATIITDKVIPVIGNLVGVFSKTSLTIPVVWKFMVNSVGLLSDTLKDKLRGPTEAILGFAKDVVGWLDSSGLKESVSSVWSFTLKTIGKAWDFIMDTAVPWIGSQLETAWNWAVEMTGPTFDAVKKGLETGDWSDLFGASLDLAQVVLKVAITLQGVSALAGSLLTGIQTGLAGLGATVGSIGKLGTGGTLAIVSVGVALAKAISDGGDSWSTFAENMGLAIASGLIAGGLTKSKTAGVWAASIILNFEVGSKLSTLIKDSIKVYSGENQEKIEIGAIITAPEVVFGDYGITSPARKKLIEIWGIDTGKEILEGLGVGLEDIEKLGNAKARDLLHAVQDELEIRSPSKAFEEIGEFAVSGLDSGLANVGVVGTNMANNLLSSVKNKLGIHSDSKAFIAIAENIVGGLVSGMKDKFPEFSGLVETLMDDLVDIWSDPAEKVTEAMEDMSESSIKAMEEVEKKGSTFGSTLKNIFAKLGGSIIGASPEISGAIEGFKSGKEEDTVDDEGNTVKGEMDLSAGVSGMLVSLLTSSEQFTILMEKLQPIIDAIVGLLGAILEPLFPVIDLLANMLSPLISAFKPLIDLLMPAMNLITLILKDIVMPTLGFLYKGIAWIYNAIANSINWLISAINKIPFVNIGWRMPTMAEELDMTGTSSAPEATETESTSSGGSRVSEITGPTRDLFVDLLSPLARLDSLTSIGNRIYDLLDSRLKNPVSIENITINGDSDLNANQLADQLEEILGERMNFAMGGNA